MLIDGAVDLCRAQAHFDSAALNLGHAQCVNHENVS